MPEPTAEISNSTANKTKPKETVAGDVASATIGAFIANFANNLSDKNPYKSWLLVCAPVISVILSWVIETIRIQLLKRKGKKAKTSLKKAVEDRINHPDTTPQQRDDLKNILYEIDMANIEALVKRIKKIDEETI